MSDEQSNEYSLGTLPASYSRVALAMVMERTRANLHGNVHGGEIMKFVDSTAGSVAQRHTGGLAVTAAMDEMAFLRPVHVGDILRTYAQVNWAGKSSLEIGVRVEAEPWNDPTTPVHVASAYLVFVAVDENGRARRIPGFRPESPDELRRQREAEIRRAHRLAAKAEILKARDGS